MTDFNYKKYSLENLENWVHDAMSSAEASPQEIYDTIKNVVQEQYYYYKDGASRSNELLGLLNGVKTLDLDLSSLCADDHIHFNVDSARNTVNDPSNPWYTYFSSPIYDDMIRDGYNMTDDGFWMPPEKEDKVVKWQLPVNIDGLTGECYVNFPDDLLEAAGLKEGDVVEWVDNNDGSFTLRKTNVK